MNKSFISNSRINVTKLNFNAGKFFLDASLNKCGKKCLDPNENFLFHVLNINLSENKSFKKKVCTNFNLTKFTIF